ncbi:MAG: hypothetical protein WB791_04125 [Waddliaceae bacterium]
MELPLWLSSVRNMPGFLNINAQKAVQAGLTFRPLSAIIESILKWNSLREHVAKQAGLDREKEKELLQLWRQSEGCL